jgi:hypothetical protein
MLQVMAGVRPSRPAGDLIPEYIWKIMQQCWSQDFKERPSILGIVLELTMRPGTFPDFHPEIFSIHSLQMRQ